MKKIILKALAGATLITGVGITSSCSNSSSLKNKTVDFIRAIDLIPLTSDSSLRIRSYTKKQFLSNAIVNESTKDGVYYLDLHTINNYGFSPEFYRCQATKDSINIKRIVGTGYKREYDIVLKANKTFEMKITNYKLQSRGLGEQFLYSYVSKGDTPYIYTGTLDFAKGNVSLICKYKDEDTSEKYDSYGFPLEVTEEKEVTKYEYKIEKDVITEINKYVALGSEDNPFSLVNKLEYSFDGTEVSYTGYPSGNVFFKINNEFYSNGLVKESKYYPWNGDNGKINEDYYAIFRFDENGKITENIIESPYQSSIGKATLTYENGTYNGEYYAKNSKGEYVKSFDITYVLDQYERLTYHVGQYCTETYIYDEGGNYFYSYELKEEAYQ